MFSARDARRSGSIEGVFGGPEFDGGAVLDALVPDPRPGWLGPLRWEFDERGDLVPRPLWALADGEVAVVEDATPEESREAWQAAAEWTQDELDDIETCVRVQHVRQSRALLLAYRTSLRDAAVRFGAAEGRRDSRAARLFFRQTALQLGMRPGQVSHRIDAIETLQISLPRIWREYVSWGASWQAVDLAVRMTDGLTAEQRDAFDERTARVVGTTPFASLKKKLRKIRADVRKGDAAETAKTVHERRSLTVDHGLDGEGSLTVTGPIVDIVAMESAIRLGAIAAHGAEDETRTLGQLQYDIARDLILEGAKTAADPSSTTAAVPARKGVVPKVVVTVPVLSLLGHTDEPARLEGYGPIDPESARRLAAAAPSFHRLLTHPVTGVRLDLDRTTYAPPADLRLWVQLRDDVCRFPGCERPAHSCDIDHAQEWHQLGVTKATNLVSLCRDDHNGKSAGLVAERLREDDGVDWETLWGRILSDPPPDPFDPVPPDLLDELDDCPF